MDMKLLVALTLRDLRAKKEWVARDLTELYGNLPGHIDDHDLERYHLGMVTESELAPLEEHLLWYGAWTGPRRRRGTWMKCEPQPATSLTETSRDSRGRIQRAATARKSFMASHPCPATLRMLNLSPHVRTGSGGAHWYGRHPGWKVPTLNGKSKQELGRRFPGVDIRGDLGYAILAGQNQSGWYEWVRPMEPDPLDVLPEDFREFLGLLHPPKPTPQSGNGHSKVNGDGRVSPEALVEQALELVSAGRGRNDSGFLLAVQLRDNGFSESDAAEVMRSYVSRVPPRNRKGQHEPYTDREALDSVRQAFSRSAREPWALPSAVEPPATRNGNHQQAPSEPQLPIVVVNNRELRDASAEAIAALQRATVPPALFVRSGEMVTVRGDELGRHAISPVSESLLRGRMTRSADFRRLVHDKSRNPHYPSVNPPIDVVRDVLALAPDT
jgi:Bifunctional DNA primase/polymerase, N-terminal